MLPFKPDKETFTGAALLIILLLLLLSRKGFGLNWFGSGFGNAVKGLKDLQALIKKAQDQGKDFVGVKVQGLRLEIMPGEIIYRSTTEINTIKGQRTVNNTPAVVYSVTSPELVPLESISVDSSGNVVATSKKTEALLITPSATGKTILYSDYLLTDEQAQKMIKE